MFGFGRNPQKDALKLQRITCAYFEKIRKHLSKTGDTNKLFLLLMVFSEYMLLFHVRPKEDYGFAFFPFSYDNFFSYWKMNYDQEINHTTFSDIRFICKTAIEAFSITKPFLGDGDKKMATERFLYLVFKPDSLGTYTPHMVKKISSELTKLTNAISRI